MRGRLRGTQLRRLAGLLDMEYSPKELAHEVGFSRRQVYRVYLPAGCPHRRDPNGRIWINGAAFRTWYRQTYKRIKLQPDQGYCLACRSPAPIVRPVYPAKGRYHYLTCTCPRCGNTIAKAVSRSEYASYDLSAEQSVD